MVERKCHRGVVTITALGSWGWIYRGGGRVMILGVCDASCNLEVILGGKVSGADG